jgi:GNAT superfamily N-acetyltransferase
VSRDIESGMAQCYVLGGEDAIVKGYYTLSSISVPNVHWDEALRDKYKLKYGVIPCALLGRLAVDGSAQGNGYGELLLMDALKNAIAGSRRIGSFAVVVDPIDQNAKAFYLKYDFIELSDTTRMYISMGKIRSLFPS